MIRNLTFAICNKKVTTNVLKPGNSSRNSHVNTLFSQSNKLLLKKWTKFRNSIHEGLLIPQYLQKKKNGKELLLCCQIIVNNNNNRTAVVNPRLLKGP